MRAAGKGGLPSCPIGKEKRWIVGRGTIKWSQTPVIALKNLDEWNDVVQWFSENGQRVTHSKSVWLDWLSDNSYNYEYEQGTCRLYATFYKTYEAVRFYYSTTKDERVSVSGRSARTTINDMFKERTGESLRCAFGVVDNIDTFGGFQYAPIIWTDKGFLHKQLNKVYKADVCSAYAFEASKKMPDAHTAITVDGRVQPTEEYPFAYYLGTNQVAIYGELDTHDYINHPLNTAFNSYETWHRNNKSYTNRLHYVDAPEKTILMKESKFTLAPEFQTLYNGRREHEEYKSIMVSAIGNLSSPKSTINGNTPMRHITSLIYARHMVRMMKLYDRITSLNGTVISIATDAIMWTCKYDLPVYETVKALGNFYLEYYNCRARIARQGIYALEKDGAIYLVKHQGYTVDAINDIKIRKLQDIDKLEYAPRYGFDSQSGRIIKK